MSHTHTHTHFHDCFFQHEIGWEKSEKYKGKKKINPVDGACGPLLGIDAKEGLRGAAVDVELNPKVFDLTTDAGFVILDASI